MARTPNRPNPKQAVRDEELRNMLGNTESPVTDDDDFPIEMGQAIDEGRPARRRNGKILGLGAGERAFVSIALLLIVVIFSVALLVATGRIKI